MKKLNAMEMRNVEGGRRVVVYCRQCGGGMLFPIYSKSYLSVYFGYNSALKGGNKAWTNHKKKYGHWNMKIDMG